MKQTNMAAKPEPPCAGHAGGAGGTARALDHIQNAPEEFDPPRVFKRDRCVVLC
jgi:hypothetical protein